MTAQPFQETQYETGWVCEDKYLKTDATQHVNLDGDPPLEIIASVAETVLGFKTKSDSGSIRVSGAFLEGSSTEWIVIGGPLIGVHFKGQFDPYENAGNNLSLLVGDRCQPKYFGAQKLSVRIAQKRVFKFYWQSSFSKYVEACQSRGFLFAQNND